jgi:hypothetical protein
VGQTRDQPLAGGGLASATHDASPAHVMPVLDTGIHVFLSPNVDGRVEPGHDEDAAERRSVLSQRC